MAREPRVLGVSNRELQAPTPRFDPNAFGAGIGSALRDTANRISTLADAEGAAGLEEERLAKAYREKDLQRQRADAQVRFITMQAEFGRAQVERAREADPSLPEFTNQTDELASAQVKDFMATLDPELQEEFGARLETFRQNSVNGAFQSELTARDSVFMSNLGTATQTAVDTILSTSGNVDITAETVLGDLERAINDSHLSEANKRTQFLAVETAVRSAQFSKLALEEQLGNISLGPGRELTPNANGVYKADQPVASGLSGIKSGLLNAIAQPESGGEYNRRYAGNRTEHFTPGDRWEHPNIAETIEHGEHKGNVSTAAGRYMYIGSTWKMVSQKYGLEDFSPANQDIGTWLHASDLYKEATNGGNLETVLRSGEPALIESARRILAQEWEGLKHVDAKAFLAAVTAGSATPSALSNDPIFEILPFTDRQTMMVDAASKANALMQQMQTEYETESAKMMQQLMGSLDAGTGTINDINTFIETRGGTVEDRDKLVKRWEENNAREVAAMAVAEKARDPHSIWVNDEQTKENLDLTYEKMGVAARMAEGDGEFFETAVMPIVEASGIVPPGLKNTLESLIYNQNPTVALANFDALSMMAQNSDRAFLNAFSDDIEKQVMAYDALKSYMPPNELIDYLRGSNNPATAAIKAANAKQVNKLINDNPSDWTPHGLAQKIGFDADIKLDVSAANAFQQEAFQLFSQMYSTLGSEKDTWNAVSQMMQRRWGQVEVGTQNRIMRNPPAKHFPPFKQSHEYVNTQFMEDTSGTSAFFISDTTTARAVAAGETPSYAILKYDSLGNEIPFLTRDRADFEELIEGMPPEAREAIGNKPARFTPGITPEMTEQLIQDNLAEAAGMTEQLELEEEIRAIDPEDPLNAARRRELQFQLEQKQKTAQMFKGLGPKLQGKIDGVTSAFDNVTQRLLNSNERSVKALQESGVPFAQDMFMQLGDEIYVPMYTLLDPERPAKEKRKAITTIHTLMDRWPSNAQLNQLRTDFNLFAREQF